MSILLPAMSRAREASNTVKCAANLRSVGQGMHVYVSENKGTFPAAYLYEGHQVNGTTQTPDQALNGYIHWSAFIYKKARGGGNGIFLSQSGWDAFTCPTFNNGGLPPTNTYTANLDSGQNNDNGAVVDQQAPRCAYTVNEAICPRNKFVKNFQGAKRTYSFVRAGQVKNSAATILAAEWHENWRIVSDAGRSDPGETVCKSHRPIHGYVGISGELNMELIPPDAMGRPTIRRAKPSDLGLDPQPGGTVATRLDWVGRIHGRRQLDSRGYDTRRSNFLYVDGHVETKPIKETIEPKFEWGERFYSLNPSN